MSTKNIVAPAGELPCCSVRIIAMQKPARLAPGNEAFMAVEHPLTIFIFGATGKLSGI